MLLPYLLLTMAIIVMVAGWVNENHSNFRFSCPEGQALTSIQSIYSNEKKYRLWEFGCSDIPRHHSRTTCFQSGYVHRGFACSVIGCLGQEFITGIYTWSNSSQEQDRGFGTVCCRTEGTFTHFCTNSPFENGYIKTAEFFRAFRRGLEKNYICL